MIITDSMRRNDPELVARLEELEAMLGTDKGSIPQVRTTADPEPYSCFNPPPQAAHRLCT